MTYQIIDKPLLLEQMATYVYSTQGGYVAIKQDFGGEAALVLIDPTSLNKVIKAMRDAAKELEAK